MIGAAGVGGSGASAGTGVGGTSTASGGTAGGGTSAASGGTAGGASGGREIGSLGTPGCSSEVQTAPLEVIATGEFTPYHAAIVGSSLVLATPPFLGVVPLDGGTVAAIASGELDYDSLAVDGDTVFFGMHDQTLMQIHLGGGKATKVASGVGSARAVDANNVYTRGPGPGAGSGQVFSVSRETGATVALGPPLQVYTGVAVDEGFAYIADFLYQGVAYADAEGVLYRVPLGGGEATTVSSMRGYLPLSLTIRSGFAYVSTTGTGAVVMRIPLEGGDAEPFAWGDSGADMVTDDAYLYFFDSESSGGNCLKRKPLAGGEVSVLARVDLIGGLAVDAEYAYIASYQSVARVHL